MNWESKYNRWILLSIFLAVSVLLLPPLTCQAGGLNVSEQELLGKAMGTFEWNGRQYRAKQMYLDQLTAYLCRDDVDLSADACDAAAAEMYGNIERGVTEGYLYEIGENSKAVKEPVTGMKAPGAEADDNITEKTKGPEEIEVQESSSLPEGAGKETEEALFPAFLELSRRQLSRVSAENYREKRITVFEDKTVWRFLNPLSYRILGGIEAVCILLLAAALVLSARRRGLRYSSRFKKNVRRIAVCMISFACFLLSTLAALWLGVFSEQTFLNQVERTSWYETIYDGINRETAMTLVFVQTPEEQPGAVLKYDRLVIAARQHLEAELKGTASGMDLSLFMAPLRSTVIKSYSDKYPDSQAVSDSANNLMDGLEMRCEELVYWAGMDWWKEQSQSFFGFLPFGLGGAALILMMGVAVLVRFKRSSYRTVKRIGCSLVWGFALLVGVSLLLWGNGGSREVQPEPAYMNEFIRYTSVSALHSALLTGSIGGCMAVMTLYISKCMKYES